MFTSPSPIPSYHPGNHQPIDDTIRSGFFHSFALLKISDASMVLFNLHIVFSFMHKLQYNSEHMCLTPFQPPPPAHLPTLPLYFPVQPRVTHICHISCI